VVRGRFTKEQIIAFNLFKKFISEAGIASFTTIVRTHFSNFKNQQKCEDDRQVLLNEGNEELSKIIKSCKGIIHVDNPQIPIVEEEDSENEREDKQKEACINEKKREKSRKIVLDHLSENCQEIYKLKG
jgi:hypothetical protein